MYNKMFLEKLLYKFVVYIFTLVLAPFTSKLFNYSCHSEAVENSFSKYVCYAPDGALYIEVEGMTIFSA